MLLFGAIALSLTLQAQITSHLTYRRYTTQDGLPQMQTERLWQDARGYIYVGTLSGFVRYDGRKLQPLLKGRRENIVGFAEAGGEVKALGFRRQWTVDFDEVEMRPIDPQGHWMLNNLNAASLPANYVLLEDEQEQHRRVCQVTAEGFKPILTGQLIDRMTPDRKLYMDSLYVLIPTSQGLYSYRRGGRRAVRLTDHPDIYTLQRTDTALLAFAADGIYAIDHRHTVNRVLTAQWSEASFGLTVRSLHGGGLVIADEHTVYHFDGGRLQQIVTGINLIRDVMVDRWDRLWIATYQGLYCFFNRCFTNHRLDDRNDIIRAVATDDKDRLVMGTLNGKLIVNDTPERRAAAGLSEGTVVANDDATPYYGSSAAAIGHQLFMTIHGGVGLAEVTASGAMTVHPLPLPQDRYRFLTTKDKRLITVSQHGVIAAYDPATGQTDTLTTQIPYPWCAAYDAEGRLWAGGTMGVYSLDAGGIAVKAEYPQKLLVTTMAADRRGTVFFASADSLLMIQQGRITALNDRLPCLAGHEIRSVHVTAKDYLIVAAVDGLIVCRIEDNYQLSHAQFYDHRNGFTMIEPLLATIAETSDGTVWLPGVEEMTSFRPAALTAYSEADTYVYPPLRWYEHWWVRLLALVALMGVVGYTVRWYERVRSRRKLLRLQREKQERQQLINSIREEAVKAEQSKLARNIVKMTEKTAPEQLTFKTVHGLVVIEPANIVYMKADGNYTQIVTSIDSVLVLKGLGAVLKLLDEDVFQRADRSTVVNMNYIYALNAAERRCVFRLPDGRQLETTLLAPAFKRLETLL